MVSFVGLVRAFPIYCFLCCLTFTASAQEQSSHLMSVNFDFYTAQIVSKAVSTENFDKITSTHFCELPDAKAMVKKMRFTNCDALLLHFKGFVKNKEVTSAAHLLAGELSKAGNGKYAALKAEVSRQIKEYVPSNFQANLNVHFIFGSYSRGFTFDEEPDDVYVDLAKFSEATNQELAETVSHELFHAVQVHVMRPESLPATRGLPAKTGPIWMNHLLVNLEQEGTAELFTHPIVERPSTPYSLPRRQAIERNGTRIYSLITMFETLAWRILFVPPNNEDAYDRIYGLMFYEDFDATAYDLGWLMASTISKKDGKIAIFKLLEEKPNQFILRYQKIALEDGKLPTFSDDFIRAIEMM